MVRGGGEKGEGVQVQTASYKISPRDVTCHIGNIVNNVITVMGGRCTVVITS